MKGKQKMKNDGEKENGKNLKQQDSDNIRRFF